MSTSILSLEPKLIWKEFHALTQIPRPSGHTEAVANYLVKFAHDLGLESFIDDAGNVIMKKPATPGMENRKTCILQAHMDMVPQKGTDSKHNFETDPIETIVDGDWLKANDTTLGADDGLGVAAIMAVMEEKDIKHGPLVALITRDEETGMYGAFGLKKGTIEGDILLNLDSEDEGQLFIGCAGGIDIIASLEYKEVEPCKECIAFKAQIKGLRGGHSGLEINEGRANANKLMARFVYDAIAKLGAKLASWEGGNMVYDRKTGILKLGKSPNKKEKDNTKYRFSDTSHTSDSIFTILGSGYNLFVRNNQTKSIHQVTFDGKEGNSYTTRFAKDTLEANTKGQWIGHRYMYMMQDVSEIKDLYIINSLDKPRPTLRTVKMPMPGDSGIKRFSIWWYNADTNEGKLLPIDKYPDQFIDRDFHYVDNYLYFTRRSRKADKIDLCRVDIATGKVQELITEECKPHLNLSLFNYKLLAKQDNKIIWWSERTGKGNYYLYDSNGKFLNRITQGDHLIAGKIANIGTIKDEIIFAAYGSIKGINPYYTHYYKVKLNGKEQVLLTPGDGDHEISFSANMKYAIDQYSRMDMPAHYKVIDLKDPQKAFLFSKIDDTSLKAAGWRPPVLLKLKAADKKTDLYGVMERPSF